TEWNPPVLYRNSRRLTPMVARSIVDKERNYIFPKKFTQLPIPPESGFCRTGSLRRDRTHRVYSSKDNGSKKFEMSNNFDNLDHRNGALLF
ncbi:hypothetical protein AVEN_102459-1, partial [Araneus ventricosus]